MIFVLHNGEDAILSVDGDFIRVMQGRWIAYRKKLLQSQRIAMIRALSQEKVAVTISGDGYEVTTPKESRYYQHNPFSLLDMMKYIATNTDLSVRKYRTDEPVIVSSRVVNR